MWHVTSSNIGEFRTGMEQTRTPSIPCPTFSPLREHPREHTKALQLLPRSVSTVRSIRILFWSEKGRSSTLVAIRDGICRYWEAPP